MKPEDAALTQRWMPSLLALCDRVRAAARGLLCEALERDALDVIARPASQGVGDVTYGIDVPAEEALSTWLFETARTTPVSLLTEDTGWRHCGPGKNGDVIQLAGFDHGGPRIVVDPIDGTRNLMTDVRSAWTVLGLAGPGASEPRLSDLALGVLSEIPDSRAARYRSLYAVRGGECTFELRGLSNPEDVRTRVLDAGNDDRADHGYFPFFKYMADMRPVIAEIEAAFFERLALIENADVRNAYDDQYISNGGQLALLSLGTYRMIADLRAWLAQRRGRSTLTSKPYDIAGAIVCARAAGCVITAVDGSALDFQLDAKTPISFVGWVNRATQERLAPHLAAVLPVEG